MNQLFKVLLLLSTLLSCKQIDHMDFKIQGVTIAVTNMEKMLNFYSNVFEIEFQKKEMLGSNLYSGKWGNLDVLLCPAVIAKNEAKQNRHQFEIVVDDLNKFIERVITNGGELMGDIIIEPDGSRSIGVYDPDRNTILIKQVGMFEL